MGHGTVTQLSLFSWLDKRIAQKVGVKKPDPLLVVVAGAVVKAHNACLERKSEYLSYLQRGQMPVGETCSFIWL